MGITVSKYSTPFHLAGKVLRDSRSLDKNWSLEFGDWSLEIGVWSLEIGVWRLEFGRLEIGGNVAQTPSK